MPLYFSRLFAVLFALFTVMQAAPVAPEPTPATDLRKADELRAQWRYEDAKKLYARWVQAHPDDGQAWFDYGYAVYLQSCADADPSTAQNLRKQARELILKARAAGCDNALLSALIAQIGEDGRMTFHYSGNPEANALVTKAEQAFSGGRMNDALALYAKALALDPKNYSATLFTGDVFFNLKNYPKADEWSSKATVLDPDRETAWRYWGDSLVHQGRIEDARDKYIEAVVAEPYSRFSRETIARYADNQGILLHRPEIAVPMTQITIKDGHIVMEPRVDDNPLESAYIQARVHWLTDERARYFPSKAIPRHSLPEEAAGLRAVAKAAYANKSSASSPARILGVAEIQSLDETGLLESYILLDRADKGIARDYETYRAEHRDKLLRYIRKIWFGLK